MYQRKIGVIILICCLAFGIGGLTIISFINYDQQNEENRKVAGRIDGNPIYAPQLTKSNSEWRNGYGAKSDGQDTNSENQPTRKLTKNAKSLIIYFSRSGSTELLASKIAKETNADI